MTSYVRPLFCVLTAPRAFILETSRGILLADPSAPALDCEPLEAGNQVLYWDWNVDWLRVDGEVDE